MKNISELRSPSIISTIPVGLVILNIADLMHLLVSKSEYPFDSEFVSAYSVYSSERIYVGYTLFFTIILLLAISFAFKRKRKLCILFLFLGAILFFYPLITASN